jgi:hypothetical protein
MRCIFIGSQWPIGCTTIVLHAIMIGLPILYYVKSALLVAEFVGDLPMVAQESPLKRTYDIVNIFTG